MLAEISISARMVGICRNDLEFFPRWNKGVSHFGLYISTTCSSRSSRNEKTFTTMVLPHVSLCLLHDLHELFFLICQCVDATYEQSTYSIDQVPGLGDGTLG
jgi:hypothetical protein